MCAAGELPFIALFHDFYDIIEGGIRSSRLRYRDADEKWVFRDEKPRADS